MMDDTMQRTAPGKEISRRDFLKFSSMMAGVLALPRSYAKRIESALEAPARFPVIWLEMQDCAGCTEALLRATQPTVSQLILDILSVDYHETIMAAAGNLAEEAKQATIAAGGYLLVVEGSIPVGDGEFYCTIGGKSALQQLNEAGANAAAVVAVGNCAAFGGWPYASPNPTHASFVTEIVKDKPVMNLPGCPYNPVNLTAAIVHFLTFNELPAMDDLRRPLFAYGARIHDNCPRRGHFDRGEFVVAWGEYLQNKGLSRPEAIAQLRGAVQQTFLGGYLENQILFVQNRPFNDMINRAGKVVFTSGWGALRFAGFIVAGLGIEGSFSAHEGFFWHLLVEKDSTGMLKSQGPSGICSPTPGSLTLQLWSEGVLWIIS